MLDEHHADSQRHSERVAAMAESLALAAGWSPERARLLWEAALVHDAGKIGVPVEILSKPTHLTDDEYATVKTHSDLGAWLTSSVLDDEQISWVRHHHERYDGSGYPVGLIGDAIPEGARLLAVADCWDAIRMPRAYTSGRSAEETLAECRRQSGRHFCPDAVAALEKVVARSAASRGRSLLRSHRFIAV
jgi:HD-GYP domain-containing protein (c-di-GMP phosphodiesterase class II)